MLLVAFNFPPSSNVGVFRTLRFARFLPASNWNTAVLCSLPAENTAVDPALERLIPEDVVVERIPLVRPEDELKRRLGRVPRTKSVSPPAGPRSATASSPTLTTKPTVRERLSELLFAIPDNRIGWKKAAVQAGLKLIEQIRPAAIYATAPPFTTFLVGAELARRSGLPLVLDFRDPWTRVPWGPRNKSWLANRLAERLEKRCVATASYVILNTPQLEQDFVSHYCDQPRQKFLTIPNGYDYEVKRCVDQISVEASSPEPTNGVRRFRILHPGSLYRNRDPRPVVDAMALLKQQKVPVLFEQLGPCEPEFDLSQYITDRNLEDWVQIQPPVSHQEMLRRMAGVDAFLLLQPGTALQIPGKLFEMVLFRKPIIAACEPGAISDILAKYRIGVTAPAGDAQALAEAIEVASSTTYDAQEWDRVLHDYDARQHASQLASLLDSVTSRRSGS